MLARDWYLLLVSVQHGRADVGRSRAFLEEALKSFPKDAHLTLALGADHEMLSDQSAGYVTYFDTDGRFRRQSEVDADDELGEAIRYMEQAVALDPKQVEARLRLGRLLYRRGELDRAAKELDAARQLTSQDELRYLALVFRGMVEAARGQLRASRQLLHRRPPPPPQRAGGRHRQGRNGLPSWSSGRSRCHHPGDVATGEEGRPVVGLQHRGVVALRASARVDPEVRPAMRWRWAVVAFVAALSSTASGQQFRSGAELVSVDVLVTDGRSPIAGLTAADFELTDNGAPQTVEQIYVEQLPLNVVMVLDSSGSVRGERLRALKAGALTVIDRLRPRDRAALVSFSHRLDLRAALTGDTATLRRSVDTLDADGSTALRDAAFAALALRTAEATRTLVLLFSDGLDTASILSEDRVLEIARRSDAIVYTIGIRQAPVRRIGPGSGSGSDSAGRSTASWSACRGRPPAACCTRSRIATSSGRSAGCSTSSTPATCSATRRVASPARLAPSRGAAEKEKRYGAGAAGILR